jgi:hypothetical protein
MKNTFLNRVSAERRVLSVVNGSLPRNQQLTGLSTAAISRWRAVVGLERTTSVNPILITVAEQCQRLSDRSNETFMPIEKEHSEKIEKQLVALQKELDRCL